MRQYASFLRSKQLVSEPVGFSATEIPCGQLFDFQADIVRWALRRGRAAIFAGTGLGKTAMQLTWAQAVHAHDGGNVLVLAPLAVAKQSEREATKFGLEAAYCQRQADARRGITITNYERLEAFDPSAFAGIVLDESSILKAFDGKTRTAIIGSFASTPYRLACTATPAPNDFMELGNHAEFLGIMSRTEMLATFFVHDGGETQTWRLKGHAEESFWKWVCSWATLLEKPSDLGYEDRGFALPPLKVQTHVVESSAQANGTLFALGAQTLHERRAARRGSLDERVATCVGLVSQSRDPWLVWCDLNAEGDAVEEAIADAVQVAGADTVAVKERAMLDFADGKVRVLVTKPKIAGFGMNWQHCANVVFVGLSDSWEQYFQAVRRCWRFGQTRPVTVHIIISEAERTVLANIERKERDARRMIAGMLEHMHVYNVEALRSAARESESYVPAQSLALPAWLV